MQENKTKKDIEVRSIGKLNISALSESEQAAFYATLLKRITELVKGGDRK